MSFPTNKTPAVTPHQTMRGHTDRVRGVVHLREGRRIVTCSRDGSLRLWDLESGTQIGEDWRDKDDKEAEVHSMALSPNGRTIVSGSKDGKVKLWDVEMRGVVAKWTGHTERVMSVCWRADGKRVLSGSYDGTARVWDVKNEESIKTIKTGHRWVHTAIYSPDHTQIVTAGYNEADERIKIWDAETSKELATLKHDVLVSLAWTSDGKKLISAGYLIRIYDTTTWEQIAILEGHTHWFEAITLFQNDRLLVSASDDKKICLWNLDTNLPVGPPIQHEGYLHCAALSADGKVLVTGSDQNVYVWDIHAILKDAGHEDLVSIPPVPTQKSLKDTDATRHPPIQARRIPPGFFDGTQSSTARGTHTLSPAHNPRSPRPPLSAIPRALLERLLSSFHHSHSDADGATELQQRPRRSIFSRGPPIVEVATVPDKKTLFVAPQPWPQQQSPSHAQGSSSQSQPTTTPAQGTSTAVPGAATAQSPRIPLWARFVLFICCASPPYANGH
ncbi:WD40 repeat-like protein [Suillus hirtellus]|nr:WD40 repeat-like protein [Suillus hirtellus]